MFKSSVNAINTNAHLSSQPRTPLEDRIAAEKPQLSAALEQLKKLLGAEQFELYINPLSAINKSGDKLLIIAGNEMRRTHIERVCISAIKEAFGVKSVHVIAAP